MALFLLAALCAFFGNGRASVLTLTGFSCNFNFDSGPLSSSSASGSGLTLAALCGGQASVDLSKNAASIGNITDQKLVILLSSSGPSINESVIDGGGQFITKLFEENIPTNTGSGSRIIGATQTINFPSECGPYFLIAALRVRGQSALPYVSTASKAIYKVCQDLKKTGFNLSLLAIGNLNETSIVVKENGNVQVTGPATFWLNNTGSVSMDVRTAMGAIEVYAWTVSKYLDWNLAEMFDSGNYSFQAFSDAAFNSTEFYTILDDLTEAPFLKGFETLMVDGNKGRVLQPGQGVRLDLSRLVAGDLVCENFWGPSLLELRVDLHKDLEDTQIHEILLLPVKQDCEKSSSKRKSPVCDVLPSVEDDGSSASIIKRGNRLMQEETSSYRYDGESRGFRIETGNEMIESVLLGQRVRYKADRLSALGLCPENPVDDSREMLLRISLLNEVKMVVNKVQSDIQAIQISSNPNVTEDKELILLILSIQQDLLNILLETNGSSDARNLILSLVTKSNSGRGRHWCTVYEIVLEALGIGPLGGMGVGSMGGMGFGSMGGMGFGSMGGMGSGAMGGMGGGSMGGMGGGSMGGMGGGSMGGMGGGSMGGMGGGSMGGMGFGSTGGMGSGWMGGMGGGSMGGMGFGSMGGMGFGSMGGMGSGAMGGMGGGSMGGMGGGSMGGMGGGSMGGMGGGSMGGMGFGSTGGMGGASTGGMGGGSMGGMGGGSTGGMGGASTGGMGGGSMGGMGFGSTVGMGSGSMGGIGGGSTGGMGGASTGGMGGGSMGGMGFGSTVGMGSGSMGGMGGGSTGGMGGASTGGMGGGSMGGMGFGSTVGTGSGSMGGMGSEPTDGMEGGSMDGESSSGHVSTHGNTDQHEFHVTSPAFNGTQFPSVVNGIQFPSGVNGTRLNSTLNGTQFNPEFYRTLFPSTLNGTQFSSIFNGTLFSSRGKRAAVVGQPYGKDVIKRPSLSALSRNDNAEQIMAGESSPRSTTRDTSSGFRQPSAGNFMAGASFEPNSAGGGKGRFKRQLRKDFGGHRGSAMHRGHGGFGSYQRKRGESPEVGEFVSKFMMRLQMSEPQDMTEFSFIPLSLRQKLKQLYLTVKDKMVPNVNLGMPNMMLNMMTPWVDMLLAESSPQSGFGNSDFVKALTDLRMRIMYAPQSSTGMAETGRKFLDEVEKTLGPMVQNRTEGDANMRELYNFSVRVSDVIKDSIDGIMNLSLKFQSDMMFSADEGMYFKGQPGVEPSEALQCLRAARMFAAADEEVDGRETTTNQQEEPSPVFNILESIVESTSSGSKPTHWIIHDNSIFRGERCPLFGSMFWEKVAVCSCSSRPPAWWSTWNNGMDGNNGWTNGNGNGFGSSGVGDGGFGYSGFGGGGGFGGMGGSGGGSGFENDGFGSSDGSGFGNDGFGSSDGSGFGNDGFGISDGSGFENDGFGSDGFGSSDGSGFENDGFGSDGFGSSDGSGFENDGFGSDGFGSSDGSGFGNDGSGSGNFNFENSWSGDGESGNFSSEGLENEAVSNIPEGSSNRDFWSGEFGRGRDRDMDRNDIFGNFGPDRGNSRGNRGNNGNGNFGFSAQESEGQRPGRGISNRDREQRANSRGNHFRESLHSPAGERGLKKSSDDTDSEFAGFGLEPVDPPRENNRPITFNDFTPPKWSGGRRKAPLHSSDSGTNSFEQQDDNLRVTVRIIPPVSRQTGEFEGVLVVETLDTRLGRQEVGTMCSDGFTKAAAELVCGNVPERTISEGITIKASILSEEDIPISKKYIPPVTMADLNCSETKDKGTLSCPQSAWGKHVQCPSGKKAAVKCEYKKNNN